MQYRGLIDVHSHLLPGIDDGCRTRDDALDCVRRLKEYGFEGTICTPHMAVGAYPQNTPLNVARWVDSLRAHLAEADLEYELWPGGELRIAEDTVAWCLAHGVPTLGPSRNVLIDYWGRQWPEYGFEVVHFLLAEGYQPILAHPERMDFDDQEWDAVLDALAADGIPFQGNLKCIAGREGPRPLQRMRRLLEAGRYHLVATDQHGPPDLDDRLSGIAALEEVVGAAGVRTLLGESPRAAVSARGDAERR